MDGFAENARSEELPIEPGSGDPRPARRRTPLALTAGVIVLAAVVGVFGWRLYQDSLRPLSPPDGPWPRTGTFLIHLCTGQEECGGRAATAAEKKDLEAYLASRPEIGDYRQEDRTAALAVARQDFRVGDILDERLMDGMYAGTLKPGDWPGVIRALQAMPGVFAVESYRDGFWTGRTDVAISLCPRSSSIKGCDGDRPGEAERQAVLDRVRTLPGVDAVYFEDAPHALAVLQQAQWPGYADHFNVEVVPEAFHVKFSGAWDLAGVRKAVDGLPGVAKVAPDAKVWDAVADGAGRVP